MCRELTALAGRPGGEGDPHLQTTCAWPPCVHWSGWPRPMSRIRLDVMGFLFSVSLVPGGLTHSTSGGAFPRGCPSLGEHVRMHAHACACVCGQHTHSAPASSPSLFLPSTTAAAAENQGSGSRRPSCSQPPAPGHLGPPSFGVLQPRPCSVSAGHLPPSPTPPRPALSGGQGGTVSLAWRPLRLGPPPHTPPSRSHSSWWGNTPPRPGRNRLRRGSSHRCAEVWGQ